jgi:hypothetical protein
MIDDDDDRTGEPVLERCLTNDATTEAIAELLSDNPRGLLLARDELLAWTRSMNQYRKGRGADRQFFLSTWSGTAIRIDRKTSPGKKLIRIPSPFLAVIGGITPEMLPELADEQGRQDGFIDRLVVAFPDTGPPAAWSEDVISDEARGAWRAALRKLWGLPT